MPNILPVGFHLDSVDDMCSTSEQAEIMRKWINRDHVHQSFGYRSKITLSPDGAVFVNVLSIEVNQVDWMSN